jgi:hypothetical protein
MLFADVPGKIGAVLFWQSGPIAAKFGVSWELTVIFIVAVEAHCPIVGVNVYVDIPLDVVLIVDGDQVPEMLFADVPGKIGAVLFWQSGPIAAKFGVS